MKLFITRVALHNALIDQSFELQNFNKQILNKDEKDLIGKLAVDELLNQYPDKFKLFTSHQVVNQ